MRNRDSLGRRVMISVETTQLESGINEPIERGGRIQKLRYITPMILTDLIGDLWKLRAEIWFEHWTPGPGATIMEAVLGRARDTAQMREINTCRTWLKVHYISDVTTVDGKAIHPGYRKGQRMRGSKWK